MSTDPLYRPFFVTGGALKLDDLSYVKRPSDDELFQATTVSEYCIVLTPRQMGKTSLTVRTEKRLKEKGILTANIDITSIGKQQITIQRWYYSLFFNLNDQLNLQINIETWIRHHGNLTYAQLLFYFIEEIVSRKAEKQIVVFIDEIDSMRDLDFNDDFFACLRSVYNERARNPHLRRISFVFLGVASPSDLINDPNRTPFNIGREIILRPFNRQDALVLEKGLEQVFPSFSRMILDRIFVWTNGHPYLTQKLCEIAIEHDFKKLDDHEIDQLVYKSFLSEEGNRESNLQFVRDNILNHSQQEQREILELYRKLLRGITTVDNKNSHIQSHLKLSGLIMVDHGYLVVSNQIYRRVFDEKWVNKNTAVEKLQRSRSLNFFLSGILVTIVLFLGYILYHDAILLPQRAQLNIENLVRYKDSRGIESLADLFQMKTYISPNEYKYIAKDTFFNAFGSSGEQKSLIEITTEESRPSPDAYRIVIKGLYTSLADVDYSGQTSELLSAVYKSLKEMGMQNETIYKEIGSWLEARKSTSEGNLEMALEKYTDAIDLNPNNPATFFERARIRTRLRDYGNALKDYDTVVAIAPESDSEPTESPQISSNIRATETMTTSLTLSPVISSRDTITLTPPHVTYIVPTSTAVSVILRSTIHLPSQPLLTQSTFPQVQASIRPSFLTLDQRIAAVSNDIKQNENLISLALINSIHYPNLEISSLFVTVTPSLIASTIQPSEPVSEILIPTLPAIFPAVAEENLSCFFGSSKDYDVNLPRFQIVMVIGKNSTGDWILVRLEEFADCWIETNLLNLQGDTNALPVVTNSLPPIRTPTAVITTPADPLVPEAIELRWKVVNYDCNDRGDVTTVTVDLDITGGVLPYAFSPALPINAVPGQSISITVSSSTSDGEPSKTISFTVPRSADFNC
jgi:tetratricopeptide (TPR) repeat protein